MTSSRRQFIKSSVLGSAVAAAGLPLTAVADSHSDDNKTLNILILGGTGFIGPHMVREALRRGHRVTLFNRGRTANSLFPDLETIKGDRDNGLDGLKGRTWDAVIDNSGYVPRHVQDSANLLASNVERYLFISTVAVYGDFSIDNTESSPLATIADESIEDVTGETYGPLKALCETRVRAEIENDKLTVIRPTYIAGPGDHTDRFSHWPIRTRRGGEMLWPNSPDDTVQVVDVRDLANFTIDCLDKNIAGTFNAVNREHSYSLGQLLEDSQAVTGTAVEPVWVDEDFITDNDLLNRGVFPTWRPSENAPERQSAFIGLSARAAGFRSRAERETIRDLLAWWDTLSDERHAGIRTGISADEEAELIAAWKSRA